MAGKRPNGQHSIYQYDGRWHVQGLLNGKRRRVSGLRRADALAAWQELQRRPAIPASDSLLVQVAPAKTVGEAVENWLELAAPRLAYSTRTGYRGSIDKHIQPHLGAVKVECLSVQQVERWQSLLLTKGLAPSTVRQARIVLRQSLDKLVRYGQLPANPVTLAEPLPRRSVKADFLSEEEAARVIAAATDPMDRARWLLALSLDLRSGEVLGLRWDDVDLDSELPNLKVTGALQYQVGVGLVRVPPKTANAYRTVLLNPPHVQALRKVRKLQARAKLAATWDFNPANYIFVSSRGTPIDPNNDGKHWIELLQAAGVRRVRRHDARHTAATLLLASGAGLADIQKMLGHSAIGTTVDTYGHLTAASSAPYTARITERLTAGRR